MTTINADINDARPTILNHFVGQQSVVERIRLALEASWQDSSRLPHMLFTGQAGLGKTGLAEVIARETGMRAALERLHCSGIWSSNHCAWQGG